MSMFDKIYNYEFYIHSYNFYMMKCNIYFFLKKKRFVSIIMHEKLHMDYENLKIVIHGILEVH